MTILLGLATCSVPIPLKATLISTLAGLARSPSAAAVIWHHIELSQIIPTVASINQFQPRSLQVSSYFVFKVVKLKFFELKFTHYRYMQSIYYLLNSSTSDSAVVKVLK